MVGALFLCRGVAAPPTVEADVNTTAPWKSLLLLTLVISLLAACSEDDPTSPCTPPLWQEVALDLTGGDSGMMAVDFTGDHGLAMGYVKDSKKDWAAVNEFFRLQADGSWLPEDLGTIPRVNLFGDLTLDTNGQAVLAGWRDASPLSVVLDRRGPDEGVYITQGTFGMLTVDGEGSFMVAGGRSRGGGLWTSTGPAQWTFDNLPLTGTNDSGFRDVYIRGDQAVACGYDDGADTLQVILTRTAATEWTKIPVGTPFSATFYCIALSESGTVFVGGIEGAGGISPKAFLSQRTADGSWTDLLLPDPELLHGVMDILIAADGSIYLACMGEGENTQANLVHAGPAGVVKEITPFPGGLLQLDQAADGSIYAVGHRRNETDGSEKGVMLVKSP